MSKRLAEALTRMAEEVADREPDERAFVTIKGVDVDTAAGMAAKWRRAADGYALRIVAPPGTRLGGVELGADETATSVRNNQDNHRGVCLVLCEGQRIPDAQGVKGLDPVDPAVLLADERHWTMLSTADRSVDSAEVREVGAALRELAASERPTALRVADFLDSIADGGTVGEALPKLGAFKDSQTLSPQRLVENLQLAGVLHDPETTRAGAGRDIKERAEDTLDAARAERVLALLHGESERLLNELSFEEAVKILREPPAKDLPDAVKEQLQRLIDRLPEGDPNGLAPLAVELQGRAEDLREKDTRQDAADELLSFHQDCLDEHGRVFREETERRLRQLRRNSKIGAGDSIERALVKAVADVGKLTEIDIRQPDLPEEVEKPAHAKAVLAYAALRLRAEPLLEVLRARDVDISGATEANLDERLDRALELLDTPQDGVASTVTLVVRGEGRGNTSEVTWTPSGEDLVLVMINRRFRTVGVASLVTGTTPGAPLRAVELGAGSGSPLDQEIVKAAEAVEQYGFSVRHLQAWAAAWTAEVDDAAQQRPTRQITEMLTSAGCVRFDSTGALLLSHLHPLKAEWLAARTEAWCELLELLLDRPESRRGVLAAAAHLAGVNASQYPAFLRYGPGADPLVPGVDGTVVSLFGGDKPPSNINPPPVASVEQVLDKLSALHREVQPQVRIAALGDHACDLTLRAVLGKMGSTRPPFERAELIFIAGGPGEDALRTAEAQERAASIARLQLRYVNDVDDLRVGDTPSVHLAVISGLGDRAGSRNISFGEASIIDPHGTADPLFGPKTWLRVNRSEQILLCPPGVTPTYSAHLAVQAAGRQGWTSPDEEKEVPTLSVDVGGVQRELDVLHRFSQWVLTVDRYAARDTLERLLGDSVAILHQERRTSGSVTEGLIISQRSGSTADRAIARALTNNQIEPNPIVAEELARRLRACASRGHGVLALRAATTGSGINELIGHVAGFAELTRRASPQPIPSNSRLVLVSLDEYRGWFGRGKRADLLVLALPQDADREVWAANVEVKTVLSAGDQGKALREAKSQLQETLKDSAPAIRPDGGVFSRMWLNRIVEAAVSVVRENSVRLSEAELDALNRFRNNGTPSNDWGGIGLVFGADELPTQTPQVLVERDRIPMFLYGVKLDRALLRAAADADPGDLLTSDGTSRELRGSTKNRVRRGAPLSGENHNPDVDIQVKEPAVVENARDPASGPPEQPEALPAPTLGIDLSSQQLVEWRVNGEGALQNGHVEIYGQSGYGKTQFVKSLLAQLRSTGSRFTVCDFKDDYGLDSHGLDFPAAIGAHYYRLFEEPVPFNPMAGHNGSKREMQSYCIEVRDMFDIAAKPYVRMGPRQIGKLFHALEESFEYARVNGRSDPTLQDVGQLIDDDLEGIIGDLFRFEFFGDGPPLGDLVEQDAVLSFKEVPGRGLTEDLLAGFILSSLYLRMQGAGHVHSTVRYAAVVDEAHRVANYKAIRSMVSEQRSKGVAVILATQRPGQLPPEVETNAQTKVFLNLPGQDAKEAAKRLDPDDKDLPGLIRNLKPGEAFVTTGGLPRLVKLRQYWRDNTPG